MADAGPDAPPGRAPGLAPGLAPDDRPYAVRAWVRGRVQGVGFRWWTRARALELGLTGYVRNCADGRVEVWAQGDREVVDRLVTLLRAEADGPRPGHVAALSTSAVSPREDLHGFLER